MSGVWGTGQGDLYPPAEGYIPRVDVQDNPGGAVLEAFFSRRTPDGQPLSDGQINTLASELIAMMMDSEEFVAALRSGRISKAEGE